MIDVTWSDGRKQQLNGASVLRIRRSLRGEAGAARIDLKGKRFQLILEQPDVIAQRVATELPSLACIHGPDGTSVYFNAKSVTGPVYITPSERKYGKVNSAIIIFEPYKQFTLETGEQVSAIIKAAGGTPEAIPPADTFMATVQGWFSSMFGATPTAQKPNSDGPDGAPLDE